MSTTAAPPTGNKPPTSTAMGEPPEIPIEGWVFAQDVSYELSMDYITFQDAIALKHAEQADLFTQNIFDIYVKAFKETGPGNAAKLQSMAAMKSGDYYNDIYRTDASLFLEATKEHWEGFADFRATYTANKQYESEINEIVDYMRVMFERISPLYQDSDVEIIETDDDLTISADFFTLHRFRPDIYVRKTPKVNTPEFRKFLGSIQSAPLQSYDNYDKWAQKDAISVPCPLTFEQVHYLNHKLEQDTKYELPETSQQIQRVSMPKMNTLKPEKDQGPLNSIFPTNWFQNNLNQDR